MHQVCGVCGIEYGVKPPDDDRVAHGLCRSCVPAELKRIKKELTASKMALVEVEQENRCAVSVI